MEFQFDEMIVREEDPRIAYSEAFIEAEDTGFTKGRIGIFSSMASDPEEYYGTPDEIEWKVVSAYWIHYNCDGGIVEEEETNDESYFTDYMYERISEELLQEVIDRMKDDAADRAHDEYMARIDKEY